jgi:serine/threonine protein kinase
VKNKDSHEKKLLISDMSFKKEVEHLKLADLIYVKELGQGQFGRVFLVKEINKPRLYALKAVSKARVVADNLQTHTIVKTLYFRK